MKARSLPPAELQRGSKAATGQFPRKATRVRDDGGAVLRHGTPGTPEVRGLHEVSPGNRIGEVLGFIRRFIARG
jgi:hypothetical protein